MWQTIRTDIRTGDRHKTRKRPTAKWEQKIIGVDGEGWGTDEHGRQNYMLMIAASDDGFRSHLYTGKRLTTHECFSFLWQLPTAHLVSYVFSYDVSQMLRDVPYDIQCKIFDKGFDWPPVTWEGWGIQFVAHKMLKLTRYQQGSLTVYDAIGFWQQSYLKTVESTPGIDPKLIEIIRAGKARRGGDTADWQQELEYSTAECSTLSTVQRNVYQACRAAGYPLSSFYGAGSLAKAMLRKHNIQHAIGPTKFRFRSKNTDLHQAELDRFDMFVDRAYFGGRFETIGVGYLPRIYMADIHNAYPYAATTLPCLNGAEIHEARANEYSNDKIPLGVWLISWECDDDTLWGPFPQRDREGNPIWPFNGRSIVWTPEILAAQRMPNVHITIHGGYIIKAQCLCDPFEWLSDAYRKRLAFKRAGDPREKVFKLGPNAVYGALAQHVGNPKYRSMIYAGLITSTTRAKLLNAIVDNPNIVAVATDSAWATEPLTLSFSDELGDWGDEGYADDVWLIQPGLAYSEHDLAVSKTRGIPKGRMSESRNGETAWETLMRKWRENWDSDTQVSVDIDTTRYIGLGMGKLLNNPVATGKWETATRCIRFGSQKRPLEKASKTRNLWRDTKPLDIGLEIHSSNRSIIAEEIAMVNDDPRIQDSLTDITLSLDA